MNAEIQLHPKFITADGIDGQITLTLRESSESVVVVHLTEARAREVIFSLEDALKTLREGLTHACRNL